MISASRHTHNYLPGLILLVFSLVVTLLTYRDYGISWDEKIQKYIGEVNYNYIANGDPALKTYEDNEYGAGYELVLTFIEKKCHITDSRNIYLMRHVVTHVWFLLCVFCGYILALRLFRKQSAACIAFVLMAFHPRIYAHSFVNTKDIPFLGIFLVALLVSQVAFEKNKWGWYLLLGACCGYATSIRIMGALLVLLCGLLLVTDLLFPLKDKQKQASALLHMVVFGAGASAALYVAWPVLWSDPVPTFIANFKALSHFPWDGTMLFHGKTIFSKALPWTYLPEWFLITTPVLWLLAGFTGIAMVIFSFARHPAGYLRNCLQRNYLLYVGCIIVPVALVIGLGSVVYDDWRHVYFIYPSFVLLAVYALDKLYHTSAKWVVAILLVIQAADVGYFMADSHPFQQVYFNQLVSHKPESLRRNYEMDYWGCAFKQGYEYILANDTSSHIRVLNWLLPVKNNIMILPESGQKRIVPVEDTTMPTYLFTNFRNHPEDYNFKNVVHEIKVENSTILRIYKIP